MGLLNLQQITWSTSTAALLEKVMQYEVRADIPCRNTDVDVLYFGFALMSLASQTA